MVEAEAPRPIWRTPLAAMVAGWMLLAVGVLISGWRMIEVSPLTSVLGVAMGVFVVAPVGLLVWSLWAMMRDPITGWIAPSALLFFLGMMVPAWRPLSDVGLRMNFDAHHLAYDAVVADAKAGRFTPDAYGWVEGARDGVRFRYRADRPGVIEFAWTRSQLFEAGVRYNDIPCKPTPQLRCLDRGQPLEGRYFHYEQVGLT